MSCFAKFIYIVHLHRNSKVILSSALIRDMSFHWLLSFQFFVVSAAAAAFFLVVVGPVFMYVHIFVRRCLRISLKPEARQCSWTATGPSIGSPGAEWSLRVFWRTSEAHPVDNGKTTGNESQIIPFAGHV